MIHLPSRIAHSIYTKTKWTRRPAVRGLLGPESHYHPQLLPAATDAGITRQGARSKMVYDIRL